VKSYPTPQDNFEDYFFAQQRFDENLIQQGNLRPQGFISTKTQSDYSPNNNNNKNSNQKVQFIKNVLQFDDQNYKFT
jgi:hypothetical protein